MISDEKIVTFIILIDYFRQNFYYGFAKIKIKLKKANPLKGGDAKLQIYGSKGTMMAELPRE